MTNVDRATNWRELADQLTVPGAAITVIGCQSQDGRCERWIVVSSSTLDYEEKLTSAQTLELASALSEAVDEVEPAPA